MCHFLCFSKEDILLKNIKDNSNYKVYITDFIYFSGFKIPVIENLGATLDQFDTLDLSDNDIRKLDGFPLLKRMKMLLLNNNKIV